jgi:hypothetical protein
MKSLDLILVGDFFEIGYYLYLTYDPKMFDNGVAIPLLANMKPSYYKETLIKQFKAQEEGPWLYFKKKKHADEAKDWVDSEIVMHLLRNT